MNNQPRTLVAFTATLLAALALTGSIAVETSPEAVLAGSIEAGEHYLLSAGDTAFASADIIIRADQITIDGTLTALPSGGDAPNLVLIARQGITISGSLIGASGASMGTVDGILAPDGGRGSSIVLMAPSLYLADSALLRVGHGGNGGNAAPSVLSEGGVVNAGNGGDAGVIMLIGTTTHVPPFAGMNAAEYGLIGGNGGQAGLALAPMGVQAFHLQGGNGGNGGGVLATDAVDAALAAGRSIAIPMPEFAPDVSTTATGRQICADTAVVDETVEKVRDLIQVDGLVETVAEVVNTVKDRVQNRAAASGYCVTQPDPCEDIQTNIPGLCGNPLPEACDYLANAPGMCGNPLPQSCNYLKNVPGACGNPLPNPQPCDYDVLVVPGVCGNPLPDPCTVLPSMDGYCITEIQEMMQDGGCNGAKGGNSNHAGNHGTPGPMGPNGSPGPIVGGAGGIGGAGSSGSSASAAGGKGGDACFWFGNGGDGGDATAIGGNGGNGGQGGTGGASLFGGPGGAGGCFGAGGSATANGGMGGRGGVIVGSPGAPGTGTATPGKSGAPGPGGSGGAGSLANGPPGAPGTC